jgi:purine catabolism regulator
MEQELGLTVGEALELSPLRALRLVAGEGGLGRRIRFVEVMEVPDIVNWVKEEEFLVTAAFSIKDDPDAQGRLIPALVAKNLAGLGIKPRRFLERIPDVMITQANELDFPLVEIPLEMSFSDVLGPIMTEIIHRQMDYLHRAEDVHKHLMEVMIKGGGMGDIATTLAELLANPVLVTGHDGEALAFACPEGHQVTLESLRQSKGSPESVKVPIIVEDRYYGDILAWQMGSPFKRSHMAAIERFSTVAALRIVSDKALFEVERRYRNEFLHEVLTGSIPSDEAAIVRGRSVGWDLDRALAVLVIADLATRSGRTAGEAESKRERLMRTLNFHFSDTIAGEKGEHVVVLVPGGPREGETILSTLKGMLGFDLKGGMGNPASKPSELSTRYLEAVMALEVGAYMGNGAPLTRYGQLGVYRLLYLIERADLGQFAKDIIGVLKEYDQKHGTDLVETINVYLDSCCNIRLTSKRMFVHNNTVLYRLQRIKEIAGLDLQDRETRLRVEVALRVSRLGLDR